MERRRTGRGRSGQVALLCTAALIGAAVCASAQGVCLEPVEPYPYRVEKSDAAFYEIVRTEYETYLLDIEAYLACLSDERRRVMARSRVILDNWVALYGEDAAIRLDPESD